MANRRSYGEALDALKRLARMLGKPLVGPGSWTLEHLGGSSPARYRVVELDAGGGSGYSTPLGSAFRTIVEFVDVCYFTEQVLHLYDPEGKARA